MISRRLILLDAVAAVAITGAYLSFASFDGSDGSPAFAGPAWLGALVAACVGLPIAVRRLWPIPAAAFVALGCAASSLLDITREPFVASALALYAVGVLEPTRRSIRAVAVALPILTGGLVAGTYVITPSETLTDTIVLAMGVWLIAGGGWAVGIATRRRRKTAERTAESERKRAATEERLRIAREIHDIVSHNLGVIAVQAGVANHVAATQPEAAQAALRSIEATSRGALAEMRRVLGALRGEAESPGDRQPTPGLGGLGELAERARAAGAVTDLAVEVDEPLPEGVELAVYRIVQEALTNVVKHAAPARCSVRVLAERGKVTVDVTDDGRPTRTAGPGHGLIGIRERVMLYQGKFIAGPDASGGFTVHATIPYGEGEDR
ncbi:sensor histidine kinase [Allorhizocola rhizosphaerae]|uniref:sensor histidine kinase n=1 Tax=Allorhizocola rhizosphaerae TaxID=1872709 RepID=UPI000E3D648A|nr:sensor histidine kinase [Allorhizocola rhizosphaerae]